MRLFTARYIVCQVPLKKKIPPILHVRFLEKKPMTGINPYGEKRKKRKEKSDFCDSCDKNRRNSLQESKPIFFHALHDSKFS